VKRIPKQEYAAGFEEQVDEEALRFPRLVAEVTEAGHAR
jgi:hypothetical protein